MTPYVRKDNMTKEATPVPCGRCPECVARRVSGWSFRLMQEDKVSTSSYFITLTYDSQYVPITSAGFMSLDKCDVQKFYKRLRFAHRDVPNGKPIKYYTVGEYGGRTMRPHYHAIIFNADVSKIQPAWQGGQIHYGSVSGASVGYTLKYMSKKGKIPMHRNDDRVPEFGVMSKGLGKDYLSEAMVKWHLDKLDERIYCTVDGTRKIAMPRYYKDKLFSDLYFPNQEVADHMRKRVCAFQLQDLYKKIAEEMEKEGDLYWRNKAENDKAAFKRMEANYRKGQKL